MGTAPGVLSAMPDRRLEGPGRVGAVPKPGALRLRLCGLARMIVLAGPIWRKLLPQGACRWIHRYGDSSVDVVAGCAHLLGATQADGLRQQHRQSPAWLHADSDVRVGEASVVGGDEEVAPKRDL
jgi:hypothetical protein